VDGSIILPSYKRGKHDVYWKSSLEWPIQPHPPKKDWALWSQALHHLETVDKLTTPLGDWIASSHQNWSSFIDTSTRIVYVENPGGWIQYSPQPQYAPYNTRSSTQPWYSLDRPMPSTPLTGQLFPVSILVDILFHDTLFQVALSPSSIPRGRASVEPHHILVEEGQENAPHPYYLELLQWDTTSISLHCETLAHSITRHELHICADGAFHKTIGQGAPAWVFSTGDGITLWRGAGLTLGYRDLMTSYRAKLAGLTSVLFVLHWVSKQIPIDEGTVTIYCDNDAALNETFFASIPSNNPYNQLTDDRDCSLSRCKSNINGLKGIIKENEN
jgi:hypothetical protein